MKTRNVFFLLFWIGFARPLLSQCSDAGVCSVENHNNARHSLFCGLEYDYGYSGKLDNIFINDLRLALNYQLNSTIGIGVSLPFTKKIFSNTNFSGSEQGIGDLIINTTTLLFSRVTERTPMTDNYYAPSDENNYESIWRPLRATLQLDAGFKLATGAVNMNQLPLRYQPGLGSNDLMLGISYIPAPYISNDDYTATYWRFWLGAQIPFGIASNSFDSIRRGPDLAAKVSYFNAIKNFDYQVELFAIKRLIKSTKYFQGPFIVTSETSPDPIDTVYGSYQIPSSDFLQLDLRISGKYYFARNTGILFGAAIPFLKRGENSDGLKRSYTLFAGISYLFGNY